MSRLRIVFCFALLFTASVFCQGFRLAVSDDAVTRIMNETCKLYNGTARNATVTFKGNGSFDYEFETSMMGERVMKFSGDIVMGSDRRLNIRFKRILSNGSSLGFIAHKVAMNNLVKETNRIAQASGASYRVEKYSQSGYKGCLRVNGMNTSMLPGVAATKVMLADGYILLSDTQPQADVKGADIEFKVSDQLVNTVIGKLIPQLGPSSELKSLNLSFTSQGADTVIKVKDGTQARIMFSAQMKDLNTVMITPVTMDPQEEGQGIINKAPDLLNSITDGILQGKTVFSIEDNSIKGSFKDAIELPGSLKTGISALEFIQGSLTVGILVE